MISFFRIFPFSLLMLFISGHPQDGIIGSMNYKNCAISSPFEFFIEKELFTEPLHYFIKLLATNELYGKWQKTDTYIKRSSKPKEGYSTISEWIQQDPLSSNLGIKFCYYGSTNKDETTLCLKILNFFTHLQTSHFEESEMTITKQNVLVRAEDLGDRNLPIECFINLTIRFLNIADNQFFQPTYNLDIDKENLVIEIETKSEDYPLNFIIRAISPKYNLSLSDILDYFIDIVLVGFTIQLLAAHWISDTLSSSFKNISVGKLIVIHSFDIYVAFQYWIGYIRSIRPIKSIPAPSLMMILAFMTSVLHAVAQRQKKINQPGYSFVTRLNYTFWLLLSVGLVLFSLAFKEHKLILLFGCLHEVPQIIQNFIVQIKYKWNFTMLVFLSLPKLFYIGWVLGFSDVILGYNCTTELRIFVFLVILQFLVLLIQMKRPRIFIPTKDFYEIFSGAKSENQDEMCSICLDVTPAASNTKEKEHHCKKEEPGSCLKVITPCKHLFHVKCLKSWTNQNPSCPYCRFPLPQIL